MNLVELTERFPDADSAAQYLETIRWPTGPVCPRCGGAKVYRINAKRDHRRLWKCGACRKPFTVTVGTIFEASHIPLNKWLIAFHLLCASKKGMSALQLSRMLGITQKSAWFLAHRIRYAMAQEPFASKLSGVVEVDETYIGGRKRGTARGKRLEEKAPVVSLVERQGNVRSVHVPRVDGENLRAVVREYVATEARIMTDGFAGYQGLGAEFADHQTVDHYKREYVRGDIHTQTVEGYFSILKRGVIGTYHHVSEYHLHRYLAEFDFRYNRRKVPDGARTEAALMATEGKRLMWSDSRGPGKRPA